MCFCVTWKELILNTLGNTPEITGKHTRKIINSELDLKLRQLRRKNLKTEKLMTSTKYPQKFGRQENRLKYFDYATQSVKIQGRNWRKLASWHYTLKGELGISMNYRAITLTTITAKVYNVLLLNRISQKHQEYSQKKKNQNIFRKNRTTTSKIWQSVE